MGIILEGFRISYNQNWCLPVSSFPSSVKTRCLFPRVVKLLRVSGGPKQPALRQADGQSESDQAVFFASYIYATCLFGVSPLDDARRVYSTVSVQS